MPDHLRIEARHSGVGKPAMHVTLNGANVTKHVTALAVVLRDVNGTAVDLATVNRTTYPVEYREHPQPPGRRIPVGTLLWEAETPNAARFDRLKLEHLTR